MKNLYTIIFASNSANKDENYALELSEIEKEEQVIKEALNHLVLSPRQNVLDKIMKFARDGKI